MDRIRLAPMLFLFAVVMFFLPFFSLSLAPSEELIEDAESQVGLDLTEARVSMSLSGLDLISLTNPATQEEFEQSEQELKSIFWDIIEPLESDLISGDIAVEDIEEGLSTFVDEGSEHLIVMYRALMTIDGDEGFISEDEYEKALEDDDDYYHEAAVATKSHRTNVRIASGLMGVTALLLVAAAVLGFVGKESTARFSLYAGAGATFVLVVFAVLTMRTIELGEVLGDEALLELAFAPGIGMIVAIIAAAAGTFLAFKASQQVAAPVFAEPAPFATPFAADVPVDEGIPAVESVPEAMPAPTSEPTVMEAPASAAPAWGATIIEDSDAAPGVFASLRVVAGVGVGRGYDLRAAGETRIGRDAAMNDIVIADAKASGQHAKVRYENNSFTLFDMGSTNGTFVNDTRVLAPVVLKMDDRVKVGDTVMVFQIAQA